MKSVHFFLALATLVFMSGCGHLKQTASQDATSSYTKANTAYDYHVAPFATAARQTELTDYQQKRWAHMDIYKDSIPGMSVREAYDFLKDKTPTDVIVAVIDSGIDIEHEEFEGEVWTNEDEIPGNGIDDDHNGYVDDIHGWNFLGGEKGTPAPMRLEITRIVANLAPKYEGKSADQIPEADKKEYEYYKKLADEVEKERKEAAKKKDFYEGLYNNLKNAYDTAVKLLGKKDFTADELSALENDDPAFKEAKPMLMRIMSSGSSVQDALDDVKEGVDYFSSKVDYMYNVNFNGRKTNDNPEDINDSHYGNNFVMGSKDDEIHGTHVSGIICAGRDNGKGVNGVTNHVKLMTVRAVPDGDENDKDVALAIRYAVDNGAKVVNMSFGKKYSPHKEWVLDAIRYAAEHDVLLVKAAGNDGLNVDENIHYPTDSPDEPGKEVADNVVCVGASTKHLDEHLCASFSNYGKERVDVFAPGYHIYNTFPKNEYKSISGTSMASPQVAGVAALIRAYYPQLTAKEVKYIIMNSGVKINMKVLRPSEEGDSTLVPFDSLSRTGRIVNAYNAVQMADYFVKNKK